MNGKAKGDLFANPQICESLLEQLVKTLDGRQMRFMEVCGTHTVSIFQSGLRSLLPENVKHLSGPGCPVCVTHEAEVALFLELALRPDVMFATFGDLLRVPGPDGNSLKTARAKGALIEVVYSPLDALALARDNPHLEVVFPGIGFETTAPTVAASIVSAASAGIKNFSVLSFHKLVPPALRAILADEHCEVDAFLLPGHVATITGLESFAFLPRDYAMPSAVGGFEPVDILLALDSLAAQFMSKKKLQVANAYPRAVASNGNPRAMELMNKVFEPADALWRGLGKLEKSGLAIRPEFADFDAMRKHDLKLPQISPIKGCMCGAILRGRMQPPQCPLFGKQCSPASPVGPCMVSTEGSCAAYFKYGEL